ncbi:MAG: HAD family hydrolase [Oscillospiraceae bacterium]|nr:HAD family hydrolase [Oscillospiraceae bacterium]
MAANTVIFDMDGTILDTLADLCDSVNATLAHFGWPGRSLDEVRRFVGNGAAKLLERAVPPGTNPEETAAALTWYRAWYDGHARIKTGPYPGIVALLERLRAEGVQLAVVSNKPDSAVGILAQAYFPGLFACAVGDREGLRPKPAPDAVRQVMDALGAQAETTVYVGDSDVDIATARAAGLPCVSVTWGFRDEAFLRDHGAQTLAHSPEALYHILME